MADRTMTKKQQEDMRARSYGEQRTPMAYRDNLIRTGEIRTGWYFLPSDGRLPEGDLRKPKVGQTLRIEGRNTSGEHIQLRKAWDSCEWQINPSSRAMDALKNAAGPIICRLQIVISQEWDNENSAFYRDYAVLARIDATEVLHNFACHVASAALGIVGIENQDIWNVLEAKWAWLRGKINDAELTTARGMVQQDHEKLATYVSSSPAWNAVTVTAGDTLWAKIRSQLMYAARQTAICAGQKIALEAANDAAWWAGAVAAFDAAWAALEGVGSNRISPEPWDTVYYGARRSIETEQNALLEKMIFETIVKTKMTKKKSTKPKRRPMTAEPLDIETPAPPIETPEEPSSHFWPTGAKLPQEWIKVRQRALPCPNCRRIALRDGSQAVVCVHSGGSLAYFRCRNCGHRWKLPVRENGDCET